MGGSVYTNEGMRFSHAGCHLEIEALVRAISERKGVDRGYWTRLIREIHRMNPNSDVRSFRTPAGAQWNGNILRVTDIDKTLRWLRRMGFITAAREEATLVRITLEMAGG
jgi:hypothetical protein